ncbi:MAG: tetratricopeptide repeat protein [Ignavibacteria bacterium]|nr:tetratricopeptide repeat protein [Ignavibacteria bacterium]
MEETESIVNCNRAISVNPYNVLEYKKRGTLNADIEKYNEAIEDYTKAIEIYPRDATCFFNRGTVRINLGDIEGAKDDFKIATILNLSV